MFTLNTNYAENYDKTVSYKIRNGFTLEFRSSGQLNIMYGTSSISLEKEDVNTLLHILKKELESTPGITYRAKEPDLNLRSTGTDLRDRSITTC